MQMPRDKELAIYAPQEPSRAMWERFSATYVRAAPISQLMGQYYALNASQASIRHQWASLSAQAAHLENTHQNMDQQAAIFARQEPLQYWVRIPANLALWVLALK